MHADKKKVIVVIVILIALASLILITSAKNCGTDNTCFNKASSRCALSKVNTISNDNNYKYEIIGKKQNNCIIEVTLLSLSQSQGKDLQDALNGRSMTCAIPQEILKNQQVKNLDNLNDYCTGQLKEAILQITVEKLYDLVVKNVDKISTDVTNLSNVKK